MAYDNTHLVKLAALKALAEKVKSDYALKSELTALSGEYNVALLYASDHGESLGENGIYLHAQPYETAPAYQKEIPMLVWLPDSSARAFGINRHCLKKAAFARQPFPLRSGTGRYRNHRLRTRARHILRLPEAIKNLCFLCKKNLQIKMILLYIPTGKYI